MSKIYNSPFNLAVIVAGLGFFVDAFDLFLFNVYRIPSLKDLGLTGKELTTVGENQRTNKARQSRCRPCCQAS